MEKTSCACTLLIQLCLCCALYIALNLGQPQTFLNTNATQQDNDIYFISVNGGFKTFNQQLHLLNMVCFHFQPILFPTYSQLYHFDLILECV